MHEDIKSVILNSPVLTGVPPWYCGIISSSIVSFAVTRLYHGI